jgi:hypothetical protein
MVLAKYSGDAVHASSSSVAVQVPALPADFQIAVTPPKLSVPTGQQTTVNVTITAQSGFSDKIALGCSTLPAGVSCNFASNNIAPTASGPNTVRLTINTISPRGGGTSAANAMPGTRNFSMAGISLPAGLLFGCVLWRLRKRSWAALTASLALLLSGAILTTGCSTTFTQASAGPGTYAIEVTGVALSSSVAHYQTVTLTITK